MFDVSIFLTDERSEKVKISIDKMNRIFYLLEGKMFSMQFPFCIDDSSNQDNVIPYSVKLTIVLHPVFSAIIPAGN